MPKTTPATQGLPIHRTADFVSRYANNVGFEPYGTDIKILFGASDAASGTEEVEQHTAITLSWPQAKALSYYLSIQLITYETQIGKSIAMHPVTIPPPIPDGVPEDVKKLPKAAETLDAFRNLRKQYFGKE